MKAHLPQKSLFLVGLLIAHLLVACVATSGATGENESESLFDAVRSKAEGSGIPVFVSRTAAESVRYGTDEALSKLAWSSLDGHIVAHIASEDLASIRTLGEKNQSTLAANIDSLDSSLQMEPTAWELSFNNFAYVLSNQCRISVSKADTFRRIRFTFHSGGPISSLEGCRMFSWVLAANGITIENKDGEENSIVLVERLSGENE